MKKSLLAVAVAATFVLAACGSEEAKADVSVWGSVEQSISTTDGVSDMARGDNQIGFKAAEDFGNGMGAFAKITLGVESEGSNAVTTKDSIVGLNIGDTNVWAGTGMNLEKSMVAGHVDVFEGNSFGTAGAQRSATNVAAISTKVGDATVAVSSVVDGSTGQDDVDSYEVAAKAPLGPLTVSGVYSKNQTTEVDTTVVGATANVVGLTVGAAYQPDADTTTVIGSFDAGNNTIRAGLESVDNGNNTTIAELQHNFSKSTNAYVNWSKEEGSSATTMVGMRINF